MSRGNSFTDLMSRLRVGDQDAAGQVFRHFVGRLIALAYRQLHPRIGCREDAEDVVQSAFKSFFARYHRGLFDFDDWDELWGLLVIITLRKCRRRREFLRAGRRDIAREVALPAGGRVEDWLEVIDREPSPPQAAMLAELVDQLLQDLRPPHREIVELCLLGYTAPEVAERVGRSERTVWRVRENLRRRLYRLINEET